MSIDSTRVRLSLNSLEHRRRWSALIVVCMGVLLVVLDTTALNVALPFIREDLGFSDRALVWVVNAYLLAFAGLLLLAGRLGDLYGRKRLFLIGIAFFTLASFACGVSISSGMLLVARAAQGMGGAVVLPVALSLIMTLFPEAGQRAKALGTYSCVCAGGGSLGLLMGGVLTDALTWRSVFLINVPAGLAAYVLCLLRLL